MPNILFASNNAAHWPNCSITSDAASFDATKVPYGINVDVSTSSPPFKLTTSTETWIHFYHKSPGINSSSTYKTMWYVRDPLGQNLIVVNHDQFNTHSGVTVYDGDGGSHRVNVASENQNTTWDIKIRCTAFLIEYNIYKNGTLVLDHTFNANVDGIVGPETFGFAYAGYRFSEFFVADGDTRNGRLNMLRPDQLGAHNDWQGSVVALADDSTLTSMTTGAVDQKQTLDMGAFAGIENISNVVLATVTKRGINSPSKLRHLIRRSGIDYEDATAFDVDFSTQVNITDYPVNPSTSVAWANSDIALTEFGFKSET